MKPLKTALIALGAACTAFGATASGSIDTTAAWNGTKVRGPFGEPNSGTFGQAITMDALGGSLQSFTFWMTALDLNIRAYVFEWNGESAVGAPLFSGPVFNIGGSFAGIQPVTVNTGGIALAPNKRFVLALSSSGLQVGNFNTNSWANLTTNAYSGGEFVFHNSGNDLASLQTPWDCADGCGFESNGADLVFRAQIQPLAPIPEPSTAAMLAAGSLVLLRLLRQRRQGA